MCLQRKLCSPSGGFTHAWEETSGDEGMHNHEHGSVKQTFFLPLYERQHEQDNFRLHSHIESTRETSDLEADSFIFSDVWFFFFLLFFKLTSSYREKKESHTWKGKGRGRVYNAKKSKVAHGIIWATYIRVERCQPARKQTDRQQATQKRASLQASRVCDVGR